MSAVTPAPDEGSNPAIVNTTGGVWDIEGIYRKPRHLQNFLVPRRQRIIDSRALVLMATGLNVQMGGLSRGLATRFFRSPIDRIRLALACIYLYIYDNTLFIFYFLYGDEQTITQILPSPAFTLLFTNTLL